MTGHAIGRLLGRIRTKSPSWLASSNSPEPTFERALDSIPGQRNEYLNVFLQSLTGAQVELHVQVGAFHPS